MKISIVVTVYNVAPDMLRACLQSVARQTLRAHEYEIIIVDDCSTENATLTVLETFVSSLPNGRLLRHERNMGPNEARRSGVAAAIGEYVVFVDGDDLLTRDAIESLRMKALATNADLITAKVSRWLGADKRSIPLEGGSRAFSQDRTRRLKDVLSAQHSFTLCGRLFRRSVLSADVFDFPERMFHEDVATLTRILFRVQSCSHIDRQIYSYTLNQESITGTFSRKHVEGIFWSLNDWSRLAETSGLAGSLAASISTGAEKLLSLMIERCVQDQKSSHAEKYSILHFIYSNYSSAKYGRRDPEAPRLRLLMSFSVADLTDGSARALNEIQQAVAEKKVAALPAAVSNIQPSAMAIRLRGKIVFICEVDYHLRVAAMFAQELRGRGHHCVVLDNSLFASGGVRQLPDSESDIFDGIERVVIAKPPYGEDWLSTASLLLTFNDFNDWFRDALEFRYRLGLSAICIVEGINDFLRVDFDSVRYLPYRRCDHVILAGDDDRQYFDGREAHVVGLPGIEKLSIKTPSFPTKALAVLNVNFTYGALENVRDEFVAKARRVFESSGLNWLITKHPMDRGDLTGLPVSDLSQYELIDRCTVFVSRFATGILEALASGKPAIYFNPHREKVAKFKEPLGAFEIASTEDELEAALMRVILDVEAGVDFRARASAFLERHTALGFDSRSSVIRLSDAVEHILSSEVLHGKGIAERGLHHAAPSAPGEGSLEGSPLEVRSDIDVPTPDRPAIDELAWKANGVIFGPFDRDHNRKIEEVDIVAEMFGRGIIKTSRSRSIMFDVGSCRGEAYGYFAESGWVVHAFEPNPDMFGKLAEKAKRHGVIVNQLAVSDRSGEKMPFYTSPESVGISSMLPFRDSHRPTAIVETIRLDDYCAQNGIVEVDFLKVDTEGYDLMVLKGLDWTKVRPRAIVCEFENPKSEKLGYTTKDLANLLEARGYQVFLSEWHPITRYGGSEHRWRAMMRWPCVQFDPNGWGNLIALRDPIPSEVMELVTRHAVDVHTAKVAEQIRFKERKKFKSVVGFAPRPILEAAPARAVTSATPVMSAWPVTSAKVQPALRRAVILGNGPSLKDFDLTRLTGIDSFGMNAAYRHWDRIGWYPTHYACLDEVVGLSHKDDIARLIRDRARLGIRKFLLRANLIGALGAEACTDAVVDFDALRRTGKRYARDPVTTGSHCLIWAAELGYREIMLLGVDADYTELVPGAERGPGLELRIGASLPNPNYFFEDYQRVGDRFQVPNASPGVHVGSWRAAAAAASELGAIVLNANEKSAVDAFDFCAREALFESAPIAATPRTLVLDRRRRAALQRKVRLFPDPRTADPGANAAGDGATRPAAPGLDPHAPALDPIQPDRHEPEGLVSENLAPQAWSLGRLAVGLVGGAVLAVGALVASLMVGREVSENRAAGTAGGIAVFLFAAAAVAWRIRESTRRSHERRLREELRSRLSAAEAQAETIRSQLRVELARAVRDIKGTLQERTREQRSTAAKAAARLEETARATQQALGTVAEVEQRLAIADRSLADQIEQTAAAIESRSQALTAAQVDALRSEAAAVAARLDSRLEENARATQQALGTVADVEQRLATTDRSLADQIEQTAAAIESRSQALTAAQLDALRTEAAAVAARLDARLAETVRATQQALGTVADVEQRLATADRSLADQIEQTAAAIESRSQALTAAQVDALRSEAAAVAARLDSRVEENARATQQALGTVADVERRLANAGRSLADQIEQTVAAIESRSQAMTAAQLDALRSEAAAVAARLDCRLEENARATQQALGTVGDAEQRLSTAERSLADQIEQTAAAIESRSQALTAAQVDALRSEAAAVAARLDSRLDEGEQAGQQALERLSDMERRTSELDELNRAISNRFEQLVPKYDARHHDLVALSEALAGRQAHIAGELDEWRQRLAADDRGLSERIEAIISENAALHDKLVALQEQAARDIGHRLETSLSAVAQRAAELRDDVFGKVNQAERRIQDLDENGIKPLLSRLDATHAEQSKIQLQAAQAEIHANSSLHSLSRMNASNAALARPHVRLLDAASLDRILTHWLPMFGLSMSRSALSYLAHRICLMEDQCEGRVATTINALILRLLAMRSLGPSPELKVLEIGTLFGIGGGLFHAFRGPDIARVRLTIIDPLSGYYSRGQLDPVTGIPISPETVADNLSRLRVPREDFRILRGLSQDPAIKDKAAASRYNLILIDGDHSREGVRRDFELYAPLLEPGGILLFDDYDTSDWPEVKEAVDRILADAKGWKWLGSDWRTGILKSTEEPKKAVARPAPVTKNRRIRSK